MITYNKKLPMIHKIISKHWNILQINPELQETFQNYLLVEFKRNKTHKKLQEVTQSTMEKCLKPIEKTEKENVNLVTQVNYDYVASRSLKPVPSKVTKQSNYTPYFTNYIVKANSSFTNGMRIMQSLNMLKMLKQLLTYE